MKKEINNILRGDKKWLFICVIILCTLSGCKDNSNLYGLLTDYDYRIAAMEKLCNQMNTNISSLQTLVNTQSTGDYITSITPITSGGVEIGYTITFANNTPITIYHGKDGKDGQNGTNGTDGTNGTNGTDGHTPVIGVAKDTDGVYYWTLEGSWLKDANGNKIRVTGKDGTDGQNGSNGTNGTDGITPQLKIEAGYWYISYDNGATWTKLDKATGADGKDGKDGDSMFKSVTHDNYYVYLVLQDGTTFKVRKNKNNLILFPYSVSATKKVYFAHGNLQYQASTDSWRIARNQFDKIGAANTNISPSYDGWIDLFGWGTSGYNMKWPFKYNNTATEYGNGQRNITNTSYDWGVYNYISDDKAGTWRTLTHSEWIYLFNSRANASKLYSEGSVYGISGMIVLPDSWTLPAGVTFTPQQSVYTTNSYTLEQWMAMEKNGALFLPAAGRRDVLQYIKISSGFYWSSSFFNTTQAYLFHFWDVANNTYYYNTSGLIDRHCGCSVRLVQDVE